MFATCEAEGCTNAWLPIPVFGEYAVICGACGTPVTNITDIKPEEGTVLPEWILEQLAKQNSGN